MTNREKTTTSDILTAIEAGLLLGLHQRTVYKLVKTGKIPGKKFGGSWRFSREALIALTVSPKKIGS